LSGKITYRSDTSYPVRGLTAMCETSFKTPFFIYFSENTKTGLTQNRESKTL